MVLNMKSAALMIALVMVISHNGQGQETKKEKPEKAKSTVKTGSLGTRVQAGSLTAGKPAAGSLGVGKPRAGSLTIGKPRAGSLPASKPSAGSLTRSVVAGSIAPVAGRQGMSSLAAQRRNVRGAPSNVRDSSDDDNSSRTRRTRTRSRITRR